MKELVTNKIRCTIIDDEQEACDRLERLLNKIDHIKVEAKSTDAVEGIDTATELYPDIVFLDVEMPGKSGFDVVKSIREKNVNPSFIFVTAYDQYAIKAIHNEAFDYLLKPVDIDELRTAIKRFIRKRQEKAKTLLPRKLKAEYALTDREIEIVDLLIQGKTSKEIAEELFISKHTVDTHRRNILGKLKINSTNELFKLLKGQFIM